MRAILLAGVLGVAGVVLTPSLVAAQGEGRTITIDLASIGKPSRLPPPLPTAAPPPVLETPPAPPPGPEIILVPAPPRPYVRPAPPAPAPLPHIPTTSTPQPSGFNPVDCCADDSRLWFDAEYLLGWVRSQPQPPLVTASPAGTPAAQVGVLGQANTTVLAGGQGINGGLRSGARFTAGLWFDECHTLGVQGGYFFLGGQDTTRLFTYAGATGPQLARPFFDITAGRPAASPLLTPGVTAGTLAVQATSDGLHGVQVLFRENCFGVGQRCEAEWVRLDVAFGYAYLGLREGLTVREGRTFLNGQRSAVEDSFQTRNEFHGGQVGLMTEVRRCELTWQAEALLAMGVSAQTASVGGAALLAQAGNRGTYRRDEFAVVPQLGLKMAWHLSEYVKLTFGYQWLWWSSVVRPGDQVDLASTRLRALTGQAPTRPAFAFNGTDVWAQGVTLGVEVTY